MSTTEQIAAHEMSRNGARSGAAAEPAADIAPPSDPQSGDTHSVVVARYPMTSLRLRGNTKHTQKNGYEPSEITVELTLDREGDYRPGTITEHTLRVHQELAEACDEMNRAGGEITFGPSST